MNKIFDVYLAKTDVPDSEAYARLDLPAQPWALLDALDKLRLQDGEEMYLAVDNYYDFGFLSPYFEDEPCSLYELNALALKLGEMGAMESAAFEGLVKVEVSKKQGPIRVPKLIDLAYSADCCHVLPEVKNDFELGGFYAGNGFVPAVEGLSDELFEMLDFEKIGRELRRGEGGVFTTGGYVVQHEDLNEVYANLDLTPPQEPDYQVLLEASLGHFGDPEYDIDNLVQLKLPASDQVITDTLTELCAASVDEIGWRCLDCRIPSLMDAIDHADMEAINEFAEAIKCMGDKPLLKYRAAIYATGCDSLEKAVELAEHLDEYLFERKITSPKELALSDMYFMIDGKEVPLLAKFTDLHGYGQAILEKDNAAITPYGLLEREDHEPIQAMNEQKPSGRMEMM